MRKAQQCLGLVLAGCILIRLASALIAPALPLLTALFVLVTLFTFVVGRRSDL